jgi:hypothetical protein
LTSWWRDASAPQHSAAEGDIARTSDEFWHQAEKELRDEHGNSESNPGSIAPEVRALARLEACCSAQGVQPSFETRRRRRSSG